VADLLYSGGPCSGKHETIPDTFTATRISCGGANYSIYRSTVDRWLGLPVGHAPPQATATATAPKAGRAWARYVHGVVSVIPAQVARSARARHHMLRIVRR
jgi:hypothetical protein